MLFGVAQQTVSDWFPKPNKGNGTNTGAGNTSAPRPDARQKVNPVHKRIFDLWMACWAQQEIADEVGCSIGEVNAICSEMAELPKLNKPDQSSATHAADFDKTAEIMESGDTQYTTQ